MPFWHVLLCCAFVSVSHFLGILVEGLGFDIWNMSYIFDTHTALFLGLPGTEPHSRQITAPAPHHSDITGWMPFLLPDQQFRSTEDS